MNAVSSILTSIKQRNGKLTINNAKCNTKGFTPILDVLSQYRLNSKLVGLSQLDLSYNNLGNNGIINLTQALNESETPLVALSLARVGLSGKTAVDGFFGTFTHVIHSSSSCIYIINIYTSTLCITYISMFLLRIMVITIYDYMYMNMCLFISSLYYKEIC